MVAHDPFTDSLGQAGTGTFRLRLLATTDLHMHLCGHNYYSDERDTTTGLTRTATLIRQARAEARRQGRTVLLLDNGDSLQGTPLAEISMANPTGPHPLMQAFRELRYDAIGLGNHDFDFGLDPLYRILNDAPCPVLCCNMSGETGPIRRSAELVFPTPDGPDIRIGLFSVLPPQTEQWNAHLLEGRLKINDMTSAAEAESRKLKRAGCDLVVALAHTGLSATAHMCCAENAILPIAELDTVDAVIAGHTHMHLPGPDHAGMANVDAERGAVFNTPVVMPGSAGSHLGVIDLNLSRSDGTWQRSAARVQLRPISPRDTGMQPARTKICEDRILRDMMAPHHLATRRALDKPIAEHPEPLHSYFSLFGPDRALALTAAAQVAAVTPALRRAGLSHLPLLSATAPCKFGGHGGPSFFTHVPAGPITLRHAADLHIYRNQIRVVRISGARVADWLEMSASLFNQIQPGNYNPELWNNDVPGYFFDVMFGLTYGIDLSQPKRYDRDGQCVDPSANRIIDLKYRGAPVAPDQRFLVALSSYRANGGGNFTALANADQVAVPPKEMRTTICDYLTSGGKARPAYARPWRFKPMPSTSVDVRTGPQARAYLDEIADLHPLDLGLGPDDFLHLRLHL